MNKYLTESEQALLLNHIKKWADDKAQRDYHIVSALMHSGMRIGEFLNITVADVIDAFKTGSLYIPKEHRKGGRSDHSVYLTKSLRIDLANLLSMRGSDDAEHFLIAGRCDDMPMSARNLQRRVQAWANDAGLSHLQVTPHFFRHTHAMNILRSSTAKEPLRIIKAALDHRNLNTTAIYTEASREEVQAALDEIDQTKPKRTTISTLRQQHQAGR